MKLKYEEDKYNVRHSPRQKVASVWKVKKAARQAVAGGVLALHAVGAKRYKTILTCCPANEEECRRDGAAPFQPCQAVGMI